MTEFERKIEQFMRHEELCRSGERIVLAVSGGADSMAMMQSLYRLRKSLKTELLVAHINHQLRGEAADGDEAFVLGEAGKPGLKAVCRHIDVQSYAARNKLSIETAARQLRREALIEIARENDCACIATAHHTNDNAETLIHRMLRGTGYRGLAGIRPRQRFGDITFIRPMLAVRRSEIIEYLEQESIPCRHDHTNDETVYTRNHIRHTLLPLLQENSRGNLVEELFVLSHHSQRLAAMLESKLEAVWRELVIKPDKTRLKLDGSKLRSIPLPLQIEAVRRALIALGSGERGLTQGHYKRIITAITSEGGYRTVELPHGFIVRCGRTIVFEKSAISQVESAMLTIPGTTRWNGRDVEAKILDAGQFDLNRFKTHKTQQTECFDADKIIGAVTIRNRRQGDRFGPIGLQSDKRVGKFLSDSRIEAEARRDVFIVADAEKIIWVGPVRACEQTKITCGTQRILQLSVRVCE